MTHPLVNNLSELSDEELQARLADLTNKYHQTINPSLSNQIVMVIEDIQEIQRYRFSQRQVTHSEEMKELDKLINIR